MKKKHIQTELDASFLYHRLSEVEKDARVAKIFSQMSAIEMEHAQVFAQKNHIDLSLLPGPSLRAKLLDRLGRLLGYDFVLGILLETEKSISSAILQARREKQSAVSLSDTAHVAILKNILNQPASISPDNVARFERRHRTVGGNALRAAVLGGNDGLVSNFSLVMGIAGAMSGQREVLLAGMAGLLAGALSMALGEWISVRSSQELYENQMDLEMEELELHPEGEEKELALIYMAKGIAEPQARAMAAEIIKDKGKAHEVMVREELGIQTEEMQGSAWDAAITSFFTFAIGAILPVIPFFFSGGMGAVVWSALLSTLGLFGIGSAITLFTGRNALHSGMRQVAFGLAAAAVTYGIGHFIGVSLAG